MQQAPQSAVKAVRNNDFWKTICTELPKHGYHEFHPEYHGKHNFVVVIQGLGSTGQPQKQIYHFPRNGKSFESSLNFKSQLKHFLRQELPNRGFQPVPDHRVRQPGGIVAHINHDVPKKQLAIPKPMLQAVAELRPPAPDIIAAPFIPDDRPSAPAPILVRKVPSNEPLSDSMVLAVFLVNIKDLSTLIDVADGTAKFRGSKFAPLRLCGGTPQQQPTPSPVAPPPPPPPDEPDEEAPPPPTNVVKLVRKPRKTSTVKKKVLSRVKATSKRPAKRASK